MLISHETPISLLEYSRSYNDYDYALVHLFNDYPDYFNFFKKSISLGRHVILDNSIFELGEAYDSEQYVYWIYRLAPTEYIIPDVLEDFTGTINSFNEFTQKYTNLPGKQIAVVQGKTYEEICDCFKFYTDKVSKIAISFDYSFYLNEWSTPESFTDLFPEYTNYEFNTWNRYAMGRIALLRRLLKDNIISSQTPRIHLLGCAVPWEFKYHNRTIIETIDTSNPIVAAIQGKRYSLDYGLTEKWNAKLVDFINIKLHDLQLANILFNISVFRRFCV